MNSKPAHSIDRVERLVGGGGSRTNTGNQKSKVSCFTKHCYQIDDWKVCTAEIHKNLKKQNFLNKHICQKQFSHFGGITLPWDLCNWDLCKCFTENFCVQNNNNVTLNSLILITHFKFPFNVHTCTQHIYLPSHTEWKLILLFKVWKYCFFMLIMWKKTRSPPFPF